MEVEERNKQIFLRKGKGKKKTPVISKHTETLTASLVMLLLLLSRFSRVQLCATP